MAKGDDKAYKDQMVVGELTDIVNQLRADNKERDVLYDRIDDVIYQKNKIEIPENYAKTTVAVHAPLAPRTINTITAALTVNPPSISFAPTGFGDLYIENATKREHFFEASWQRQERESGQRLFRKFIYSVVSKGEGVLKTVERQKSTWSVYTKWALGLKAELDDEKALTDDERDASYKRQTADYKKKLAYPIVTSFVPARTFYGIRGERGFTFCAEVKVVSYSDTLARYRYQLTSEGKVVPEGMGLPIAQSGRVLKEQRKTLLMLECWDVEYASYILVTTSTEGSSSDSLPKGELVKRFKHGYRDPTTRALRGPYFHAYGLVTDDSAPERAGLGILNGYLDLYPLLDSYLTMQSNSAYQTGYPAFKKNAPNGAGLPPGPFGDDGAATSPGGARVTIKAGEVLPFDVSPIDQPRYGVDLDKAIGQTKELLEPALPAVLQGIAPGDSGYQDNQAQYLASIYHSPLVQNAEVALADRVGFESWLIEHKIGEPVYVWDAKRKGQQSKGDWIGLGPKDFDGNHTYAVHLDPKTPSNEVIEVRMLAEKLAQRLTSPNKAIEQLGDNPDEVERDWKLWDLKQDPEIQRRLRDAVFGELDLVEQRALAGQPGPGVPPTGAMGAPGDQLGGAGQVFQPGQAGMPLAPTPPGSGNGAGPGGVGGAPVVPGAPAGAMPLPGQGG